MVLALASLGFLSAADRYTGPPPPKKDLPYIVQADNLIPTEPAAAKCETKKDDTTCVIPGVKSAARTPLAGPTFIVDSDKLSGDRLQLYPLTVKNGHREVTLNKKGKGAHPVNLNITKTSSGLFQIEVHDSLPPGEYVLSPDGSDDSFCFEVF